MKEDLTELILDYREAMRQLWNNHARHYDFGHRFGAVAKRYNFKGLAHCKLRLPIDARLTQN